MQMNKQRKCHILLLVCVLLSAVLLYILFTALPFNPGRIYNNDHLIVKENDTYHSKKDTRTPFDENGETNFSIEYFSGCRTIHIIESIEENKTFSFTWNVTASHGRFKIVLVNTTTAEITKTLCDGSGQGQSDLLLSAGEYRIKFVGERAAVMGQLKIEMLE